MKVTCWVVPVEKDDVPRLRELAAALEGPARGAYVSCQRRTGAAREMCFLWETADRAYCLLYLQSDDIRATMEAFENSTDPFDAWFREQLGLVSAGWPDPGWGAHPTPGVAELLSVYESADESLTAHDAG
ncbi:hypothetical protein [Streptomyces sp. NPDC090994]|uniref:hypothetical protein n=1 Tax=Streptomyces sp. NPDC090994 TaxID=3365969 RepID=UPI003804F6C3